jgi:hypothetical protein
LKQSQSTLTLSNLKAVADGLSQVQCNFYSEACAVAFEKNNHISETKLTVDGVYKGSFQVVWEKATSLTGWQDNDVIAENAAIAIACFLVTEVTEYTIVRQSIKGTGFDYWLGYKTEHPKFDPSNFLLARLEISGIFHGTSTDLNSRVQKKLKQVDRSAKMKLPAFIAVTEFGNCKSYVATK